MPGYVKQPFSANIFFIEGFFFLNAAGFLNFITIIQAWSLTLFNTFCSVCLAV